MKACTTYDWCRRGYRHPGPCVVDGNPKPKRRKTYDTGFRDGISFAVAVQVIVFAAAGIGYAVAQALT